MTRREPYRDRTQAGQVLAEALADPLGDQSCVVLALPRGGVPVAVPVAERLSAPLGLMEVRKIGVPGRPEVAMGALARTGQTTELVRHERVIADACVDEAAFERIRRREEAVLADRVARYKDQPVDATDRAVVLVDDGLATGMTALAAVAAARALKPRQVVVAVPVGSTQAVDLVGREADLVVCPLVPRGFYAVSTWYRTFDQLSDEDVIDALARFRG
jgi:predicted phosphoribosyltransferase